MIKHAILVAESPRTQRITMAEKNSAKTNSAESTQKSVGQEPAQAPTDAAPTTPKPKEIGGRDGLEPTRYGDWEKNGRCIDF